MTKFTLNMKTLLLVCFICFHLFINVSMGNSFFHQIQHQIESAKNVEEVKEIIKKAVIRLKQLDTYGRRHCRMQACMEKFNSVNICTGSGAFYLWAKRVASEMGGCWIFFCSFSSSFFLNIFLLGQFVWCFNFVLSILHLFFHFYLLFTDLLNWIVIKQMSFNPGKPCFIPQWQKKLGQQWRVFIFIVL